MILLRWALYSPGVAVTTGSDAVFPQDRTLGVSTSLLPCGLRHVMADGAALLVGTRAAIGSWASELDSIGGTRLQIRFEGLEPVRATV